MTPHTKRILCLINGQLTDSKVISDVLESHFLPLEPVIETAKYPNILVVSHGRMISDVDWQVREIDPTEAIIVFSMIMIWVINAYYRIFSEFKPNKKVSKSLT